MVTPHTLPPHTRRNGRFTLPHKPRGTSHNDLNPRSKHLSVTVFGGFSGGFSYLPPPTTSVKNPQIRGLRPTQP